MSFHHQSPSKMKTIRLDETTPNRQRKMPSTSLGNYKRKRLLIAIKNNNVKDVIQLLKEGCSPSKKLDCYKSRYPLAIAVEQQNIEIISILLQHGACVNTPIYSFGWTALQRAVVLKNIDIIETIMQYNANWNITDKNGETVLHLIFKEMHAKNNENDMFVKEQKTVKILKIFLDLGMDVNVKTNAGRSPLYLAVKNKMRTVVEFLIKRGADLNVCDYKGDSLAHLLVKDQYRMLYVENPKLEEQNRVEFLDWLLLKGVNVDCKNKIGELPLQLSLKHKLLQTFQVLLKYANNVNFTDDRNRTVLHILFEMSGSKEIKNTSNDSGFESDEENEQISENSIGRIVKVLLEKGASVDVADNNGNTPLIVAAEKKMFKCLLMMLERYTDVNACNNNLETVLHILSNITIKYEDSIVSDIISVAQVLICKGINVNKINKDQMTVLQLAALHKNNEMLELLRNHGADLQVRTIYGESLLHLAIKLSDKKTFWRNRRDEKQIISTLDILLNADMNVNSKMHNGETPLYLAVKNKMKNVVEFLIRRGADLNICNNNGDSLAHYLINQNMKLMCNTDDDCIQSDDKISSKVRGNLDFMDWLLSKGVNVDLKNDSGEAPLQLAIKYNLLRVVPIMLKYANEVNFINERKLTILHMILQLSDQSSDDSGNESTSEPFEPYVVIFDVKNVIQTLLDKGISVEIRDTYKNTALHIAAQQTRPELVSLLLKYTTNVNVTNDLGWTPLHFACQTGNVEMVKSLIEHGADVDATEDISSITPLFVAVYNDHEDVIEVLAKAGADLNAKDATGQTVLHTVDSLKSSMSVLLRLCADVDAKDNWGHVPLYYAMTRQDAEAIGQLLDYGANVSERTLSNFVLRELLESDSVMGHHAKLMAAQLSIPAIYTSLTFHGYVNFYKECLKEVEKMRACEIDDRTSLYDFLHMSPKSRQTYERKETFRDVTKLSSLTKQFPLYCDIIWAKCQQARIKRSLVKSAKYAWWELTDILLPDVCLENILENLDKLTLKNMGEGMQTMKRSDSSCSLDIHPSKRQRLM